MNHNIKDRIDSIVRSGQLTTKEKIVQIMDLFEDNEKCTCNNFHEGNCTKSNFYEYEFLEHKYILALAALKEISAKCKGSVYFKDPAIEKIADDAIQYMEEVQ